MFIVQLLHQMVDVILSQYIGFFVKFNNILYFNFVNSDPQNASNTVQDCG
jgi:hypothetical protein